MKKGSQVVRRFGLISIPAMLSQKMYGAERLLNSKNCLFHIFLVILMMLLPMPPVVNKLFESRWKLVSTSRQPKHFRRTLRWRLHLTLAK